MLIFDPSMRQIKPATPWYRVVLRRVRRWLRSERREYMR